MEKIARGLELQLTAGLIEEQAVNVFDGGGFEVQKLDGGLHGVGDGGEKNQAEAPGFGERNDFQFGGSNGGKSAFAAGKQVAEIIRVAQETVQAVARAALQQAGGEMLMNGGGVIANQLGEEPALGGEGILRRGGLGDAAVGQDDFKGENVIGGKAVEGDMGAGGVVGNHAAQSGARTCGDIRAETKAVRLEEVVELVEDHAGADAHGAAFEVERGDLAVMAGEINDHTRADRAAGQTGAGAARDNVEAGLRRGADDGSGLGGAAREGDGAGFDLIKGSIGGVKLAGEVVEGDITIGGGKGGDLLGRSHAMGSVSGKVPAEMK